MIVVCDHCGAAIDVATMSNITIIWCKDCVLIDLKLLEAQPVDDYRKSDWSSMATTYGYVGWGDPGNAKLISDIPKRVQEVPAPKEEVKEVIVIKAQEVPSLCKKAYYGTSCLCSKCGTTGQVLPYRDVFGYGKEKSNEQRV